MHFKSFLLSRNQIFRFISIECFNIDMIIKWYIVQFFLTSPNNLINDIFVYNLEKEKSQYN